MLHCHTDSLFTLLDLVSVGFPETTKLSVLRPPGQGSLRTLPAPAAGRTRMEFPGMAGVKSTLIKIAVSGKNVSVRINFMKRRSTDYQFFGMLNGIMNRNKNGPIVKHIWEMLGLKS